MSLPERVDGWVESNRERILSTVADLVRIRTENLPPGGNEKPGQEYLHDLASRFLPAEALDLFEVDDVPGIREHPLFFPTIDGVERVYRGRPILVARRAGRGGGPSLVFSGHMDTMPTYGKSWEVFPDPYSGRLKDGWLYGRGAIDMKAGTACGFLALRCLHELGLELKGDVYAESVVDEENGGVNGTLAARLRNPHIDFAILPEPCNLAVGIESIGGCDLKATRDGAGSGRHRPGRAAAQPDLQAGPRGPGPGEVRPAPGRHHPAGHLRPRHAPPPAHLPAGLRRAGVRGVGGGAHRGAPVLLAGDLRRQSAAEARREFLAFMERELAAGPQLPGEPPRIETVIRLLEGHRTDRPTRRWAPSRRAYGALGLEHAEKGIPFATDAFAFRRASRTDVAIVGPVGRNPHGLDEYVEVESVLSLLKVMVLTAVDYCG